MYSQVWDARNPTRGQILVLVFVSGGNPPAFFRLATRLAGFQSADPDSVRAVIVVEASRYYHTYISHNTEHGYLYTIIKNRKNRQH